MISDAGMPDAIAVAYTNGLNTDPGCRMAWVARLNSESPKSRPPTIARTSPVAASSAMNIPCT